MHDNAIEIAYYLPMISKVLFPAIVLAASCQSASTIPEPCQRFHHGVVYDIREFARPSCEGEDCMCSSSVTNEDGETVMSEPYKCKLTIVIPEACRKASE